MGRELGYLVSLRVIPIVVRITPARTKGAEPTRLAAIVIRANGTAKMLAASICEFATNAKARVPPAKRKQNIPKKIDPTPEPEAIGS